MIFQNKDGSPLEIDSIYGLLCAQLDNTPEESRVSAYKTRYECWVANENLMIGLSITGRNTYNETRNYVQYQKQVIDDYELAFVFPAKDWFQARGFRVRIRVFPHQSLWGRIRSRYWLMYAGALWWAVQFERWLQGESNES